MFSPEWLPTQVQQNQSNIALHNAEILATKDNGTLPSTSVYPVNVVNALDPTVPVPTNEMTVWHQKKITNLHILQSLHVFTHVSVNDCRLILLLCSSCVGSSRRPFSEKYPPEKTAAALQWSTVQDALTKRAGNRGICNNFYVLHGVFPLGFTNPEPPVIITTRIIRPIRPSFRLPVDGTAVLTAIRPTGPHAGETGAQGRDGTVVPTPPGHIGSKPDADGTGGYSLSSICVARCKYRQSGRGTTRRSPAVEAVALFDGRKAGDGARGGRRWASAVGVVIDEGFGWLVGGADVGVAKGGVARWKAGWKEDRGMTGGLCHLGFGRLRLRADNLQEQVLRRNGGTLDAVEGVQALFDVNESNAQLPKRLALETILDVTRIQVADDYGSKVERVRWERGTRQSGLGWQVLWRKSHTGGSARDCARYLSVSYGVIVEGRGKGAVIVDNISNIRLKLSGLRMWL
ncbi:hypothetical protein DFH08DRAFT_809945 [Mycena albidolilacea]|uniref:Uncharacterized protein n=1 Tax=Mycena albidolilacea TaxID=1033008 RepID=A0AAD6ZYR5_9AGAR|nr:hypothetical protein DFH08DRAFT_809945 [Mycena albidolilacea]